MMPCGVRLVDQRIGRRVAGMAHEGDAVDLGGDRLLQLGDHQVRIPVGEVVGDRRSEIELGLTVAVVDVVGEDAALRSARESGDLDARAPFRRRIERVCRGDRAADQCERRRRDEEISLLRFTHRSLPASCELQSPSCHESAIIVVAPLLAPLRPRAFARPPTQRPPQTRSGCVRSSSMINAFGKRRAIAGPNSLTIRPVRERRRALRLDLRQRAPPQPLANHGGLRRVRRRASPGARSRSR